MWSAFVEPQQSCLEIVMTGMLECLSAAGVREVSLWIWYLVCRPPRHLFAYSGSQVLAWNVAVPSVREVSLQTWQPKPFQAQELKLPAEFVQTWQHILCHPRCCHILFRQLPLQVSLAGPNSGLLPLQWSDWFPSLFPDCISDIWRKFVPETLSLLMCHY